MRRLAAVQTAGKDILFQLLPGKLQHGFGRIVFFEELFCDLVHALVRTLRGKDDRHQQFVSGGIDKRRARVCVHLRKYLQSLFSLLFVHAAILP